MSKKKKKPAKQSIPLLQTAFFFQLTNSELLQRVEAALKSTAPDLEEQVTIESIRKAQTPFMLLGLAEYARGIARIEWATRMDQFGLAAIPALQRGLRISQSKYEAKELNDVVEQYIAALARLGSSSGEALLECFNSLDDHGQSLACVTFGVLHTQKASDIVWRYYQRIKDSNDVGLVVGALFGLVYLSHPQVDEALAEAMREHEACSEFYALAAMAGRRDCAWALVMHMVHADIASETFENERLEAQVAMSAVAERIGLEEFRAVLKEHKASDKSVILIMEQAEQVFGKARMLYEYFYNALPPSDESPMTSASVD